MGKRVLVDVERGRTVRGWKPRRLGGGLGGRPKPEPPMPSFVGGGGSGGGGGGSGMREPPQNRNSSSYGGERTLAERLGV